MGYWNSWRTWKFYEEQVEQILALIKRKYKDKIDIDKYLMICEQTGEEPDANKMPPEMRDFPPEVQMAFHIYSMMPDRFEGMGGSYMGKDWSSLSVLYDIYEIDEKKITTFFLKCIENEHASQLNEELKRKQDAKMRQSKANTGGISSSNIKRK